MKRLAELRAQLRPILIPIVLAGATAILTAVAWASWSYRRMADAALDARFIPRFKDPPPGPRAPGSDAFGARVGASSLQDVQQLVQRMGIDCPDTSARALLGRARAARVAAAEDRKRRGLPPDAVSGASGNRRSPMERNPQVRLSCEDLPASALTDRPRAPSIGRLLFVFDSPEHPVRHISYQRTHARRGRGPGRARGGGGRLPAAFRRPPQSNRRPTWWACPGCPRWTTSGTTPTSPCASPPSTSAAPAAPC